jgi:hypothetical protein
MVYYHIRNKKFQYIGLILTFHIILVLFYMFFTFYVIMMLGYVSTLPNTQTYVLCTKRFEDGIQ